MKEFFSGGLIMSAIVALSPSSSPPKDFYAQSVSHTTIKVTTTQELIERTPLYTKANDIEKKIDSFHIEVQKLRKNEKVY